MGIKANNNDEGDLTLSSSNYVTETNIEKSTEGTLVISSSSSPAKLDISKTAETKTLKVSADGSFSTVNVVEPTKTDLKISNYSILPEIKIDQVIDKGVLKLSAENISNEIMVSGTGTVGNLKINSIHVSDITIEVGETITLPYGEYAYVNNSGTNKHVILDFGIPEGKEGNGIDRIELIKIEGLAKTYRIYFTDGSTYDYIVMDGSGTSTSWGAITGNIVNQTDLQEELNTKQDVLVSGENIKTVNNLSLVGSGNIDVISVTFTYEQGEASDTWVIKHDLNKYPSVSVTDSAGSTVECAVIYNDTNNCTLKMNGAFKGIAYLN